MKTIGGFLKTIKDFYEMKENYAKTKPFSQRPDFNYIQTEGDQDHPGSDDEKEDLNNTKRSLL